MRWQRCDTVSTATFMLQKPPTADFCRDLWKTWMQNLTSDHQHRSGCPRNAGTNGVNSVDSKLSCSTAITHCVQFISSMFMHLLSSTRKGWLNQRPRKSHTNINLWEFPHLHWASALQSWPSVAEWTCWVPLWLTKIVLGTECQSDNPAVAYSPFPRRVTQTWCREKHRHHLTKVWGWQQNHQQTHLYHSPFHF